MQYPECEEPLLTVGLTEIFGRDRVAIQNLFGVCEVNGVFIEVCSPLVLVQVNMLTIVASMISYGKVLWGGFRY